MQQTPNRCIGSCKGEEEDELQDDEEEARTKEKDGENGCGILKCRFGDE